MVNCSWQDAGKKECDDHLWVVAYACPECVFKGTLILCTMHYAVYSFCAKEKLLMCGKCNHFISIMSHEIETRTEEEYIHDV